MNLNLRSTVESLTSFLEFLADHFNETLGHILIKASPLIAPLPSAIAIYNSLYVRLGVIPALIVTFVVEGLGFAAVDSRNTIEQHNRTARADSTVDSGKANMAVRMYFIVTLITIVVFESMPAWAKYIAGEEGHTIIDALIHTAPLVFPFFSNIGASIYSLMDVMARIADREAQEAEGVVGELEAEIERLNGVLSEATENHSRSLVEQANRLRVEATENADRAIERVRSEYEITLAELQTTVKFLERQVEQAERFSANRSVSDRPVRSANSVGRPKKFDRQIMILDTVKSDGYLTHKQVADTVGSTKSTVGDDIRFLITEGVLVRQRDAEGNEFLHVNGKERDFRNGELG